MGAFRDGGFWMCLVVRGNDLCFFRENAPIVKGGAVRR